MIQAFIDGYFSQAQCESIKSKMQGKTFFNFDISYSNEAGNCTLIISSNNTNDFSIADNFGITAVKDTYTRGIETASFMGYKYLTEFVMALNLKIWEHYERNAPLASVYNDLWEKADIFAQETLKGEELAYYYSTTD